MGAKWLIGVGLNLVGSVMINLGTNLMKLGHNRREALPGPESARLPVRALREWRAGAALFAAGNVANFGSLGFAAQSLLSAIGSVQFVTNVAFASLVLKERVTRGALVATALIVGGCALLVAFGDHASHPLTARDLVAFYAEPGYVAYLTVGAAAAAGCYLGYRTGRRRVAAAGAERARVWAACLPLLYSGFAALVGSQSVIFSKTIAVLLRTTAGGDNQFKGWLIYAAAPLFLVTAAFWITRLNDALRLFPAVVVVPTLQIAWTLAASLSGLVYFREYRGLGRAGGAAYGAGLAVMCCGVLLLARTAVPPSPPPPPPPKHQLRRDGSVTEASLTAAAPGAGAGRAAALDPAPHDSDGGDSERIAAVRAGCGAAAPNAGDSSLRRTAESVEAEDAALLGSGGSGEAASTGALPQAAAPGGPRGAAAAAVAGLWRKRLPGGRGGGGSGGGQQQQQQGKCDEMLGLDEAAAARLALGLGDADLPAVSLFGPPMLGLHASSFTAGRHGLGLPITVEGPDGALAPPLAAAVSLQLPGRQSSGIDPLSNAISLVPAARARSVTDAPPPGSSPRAAAGRRLAAGLLGAARGCLRPNGGGGGGGDEEEGGGGDGDASGTARLLQGGGGSSSDASGGNSSGSAGGLLRRQSR